MKKIEDLTGKVAVVTGGASGIGRGIATELIRAGARVVIADVNKQTLEPVAQEIGAVGIRVDVTDPDSVQNLVDAVVARFGTVDILVNNAGVGPLGMFNDLTLEDYRWVMDINFWGVIHGIKSFLPILQANEGGGYIVNTASLAAFVPAAGTAAYAASKAAVVAVSESLAEELTEEGKVGVSILAPGIVRTNINANANQRPGYHEGSADAEEFLPPLRMIEPGEVGQLVVDAIRDGTLYIFTHPETLPAVERRFARVKNAFEKAAV